MGMDYYLIAKNEDIHDDVRFSEIESSLDRPMNAFIDGENAYGKKSEYSQIQRVFEIDLSPFQVFNNHNYFLFTEGVEGELDYKLYGAKTEEEKNKLKAEYKPKLEEAKIKDIEHCKNTWVETKVVKQMLLDLIQKMETQPELLDKIEYGFFKRDNFKTDNFVFSNYIYYIIIDFNRILTFIDYVESKGETHMAFYCM